MNQLFDFFNNLLNTNQQHPHWPYAGWSEFHHWLHISSTAVIWLSYLILLLFLATLILRKNKVVVPQSIWWLAAFICLSGFTHLMDIVVIWWPAYRLHTLVRLLTALLAVGAVFSLLPNFYSILDLKSSKAFDQELNRLEKTELQLRKAKQELENNNRELMVKNEEVQQLATIVSHDLKAPLQSFTSVLDLLKKQTNLLKENEPGEYIGYLEESSERMQTLITDLLDYARLGSRRELSEVNLNDILLQARSDLRAQIEASTAEIRVDSMPTINGYKTELRMLFQNLLNNALKYSKQQTPPLISVRAEERTNDWLFVVEDQGRGISKEDQKKIFMIFETLDDEALRESTGIGLAHCKKIVEMHHGKIWVQSEVGIGSAFYFTVAKELSNNLHGSEQ